MATRNLAPIREIKGNRQGDQADELNLEVCASNLF